MYGGERYHKGILRVILGRVSMAMKGVPTMLGCGKRKETWMTKVFVGGGRLTKSMGWSFTKVYYLKLTRLEELLRMRVTRKKRVLLRSR